MKLSSQVIDHQPPSTLWTGCLWRLMGGGVDLGPRIRDGPRVYNLFEKEREGKGSAILSFGKTREREHY